MAGITELARMMKKLEEQLVVCMRCGLCQSVCPLYAETGRESDVARGKLALLDCLASQMLDDPQGVKERLDRCLLCGSCQANCPSGVSTLQIFLQARAILTGYLGLHPAKKVIFRALLSNPGLFDRVMGLAGKLQGLFTLPVDTMLGTSCARIQGPLGDRHLKNLAPVPFHRLQKPRQTRPRGEMPQVAFFVGCIVDKIFPGVASSVVKIADHHGLGLSLPGGQACCGIPALSSGDLVAWRKLLRHQLETWDPTRFDYLVTPCATCTSTIKKLWPTMTEGLRPAEIARLKDIAAKAADLSQVLVERGLLGPAVAGSRVATYHDPCHLKKSLGVSAQPRAVLAATAGVDFREMPESDWCCGMGGSFNLLYYEQSARIGRRKLQNIQASGATEVLTACPACMVQITDQLSKAHAGIKVRHYLEAYAEGLN